MMFNYPIVLLSPYRHFTTISIKYYKTWVYCQFPQEHRLIKTAPHYKELIVHNTDTSNKRVAWTAALLCYAAIYGAHRRRFTCPINTAQYLTRCRDRRSYHATIYISTRDGRCGYLRSTAQQNRKTERNNLAYFWWARNMISVFKKYPQDFCVMFNSCKLRRVWGTWVGG